MTQTGQNWSSWNGTRPRATPSVTNPQGLSCSLTRTSTFRGLRHFSEPWHGPISVNTPIRQRKLEMDNSDDSTAEEEGGRGIRRG